MATLRLFASVREAAGTGRDIIDGATVADVVASAIDRFGPDFAARVQQCRIWVDGEPAEPTDPVGPDSEVALLPPVSGG